MYQKERKKLAIKIEKLFDIGMLNIEGGGVSIRLPGGKILATPTGGAFRLWKIEPEDILVTDKKRGRVIEKGRYLAMAEFPLDLHIFNRFSLCNAIFHVHGPYSLVYASMGKPIPKSTNHVEILGEIPCLESPDEAGLKVEYLKNPYQVVMPEAVVQRPEVYVVFKRLFRKFDRAFAGRENELEKHGLAFTVEKHGLFVLAKNLDEAIENAVRVEAAARTQLFINSAGGME